MGWMPDINFTQLEKMNEYYGYVKTTIGLFSPENVPAPLSVPEPPSLRRLRTDLEVFTQDLQRLIESCSVIDAREGEPKISRLKWLRNKNKIVDLSRRCRDLRHHLEGAITPLVLQVQRYVAQSSSCNTDV